MKITYIEHSCFCVEFEDKNTIFVFDWYKGNLPDFNRDANLYFFASHKHFDHYSKKVFEFADVYENTSFILSNEIKMNEKYMNRWKIPLKARDEIIYVHKDNSYTFKNNSACGTCSEFCVDTLTSTDSGVAFVVSAFGKTIYHAGDLNWWSWEGESEEQESDMETRFKKEMKKLAQYKIDIAFLPLDPRQKERFFWGFDYCMKACDILRVFPMHMWDKYETVQKLKDMDTSAGYRDKIQIIEAKEQVLHI